MENTLDQKFCTWSEAEGYENFQTPKEKFFRPKIFAPGAKRKDAKILKPPKENYIPPKIFAPGAKRKDAKILKSSNGKYFGPKILHLE